MKTKIIKVQEGERSRINVEMVADMEEERNRAGGHMMRDKEGDTGRSTGRDSNTDGRRNTIV